MSRLYSVIKQITDIQCDLLLKQLEAKLATFADFLLLFSAISAIRNYVGADCAKRLSKNGIKMKMLTPSSDLAYILYYRDVRNIIQSQVGTTLSSDLLSAPINDSASSYAVASDIDRKVFPTFKHVIKQYVKRSLASSNAFENGIKSAV